MTRPAGFAEFLQDLGHPIALYRNLAHIVGGVKAAVLVSQLLYWTPKSKKDGWIYKTPADFVKETALTLEEQRGARGAPKHRPGPAAP